MSPLITDSSPSSWELLIRSLKFFIVPNIGTFHYYLTVFYLHEHRLYFGGVVGDDYQLRNFDNSVKHPPNNDYHSILYTTWRGIRSDQTRGWRSAVTHI